MVLVLAAALTSACGDDTTGSRDASVPVDGAVSFDMPGVSPPNDIAVPLPPSDLGTLTDDGGQPLPPPPRPFGPWVAFASNRGGDYDIYLVHPDGTGLNALAQSTGDDLFPSWSPDGARVVYASNRGGPYALYEIDVVTNVETNIPTGVASATAPSYSPDGTLIAFGGDGDAIYTVPVAGGTATALTDGMARDNSPVWAPDGSVIYFSTDRSGDFEVWSVKPNGTGLTQITTGTNLLGGPAISPDGKTLAFAISATQTSVVFWTLASSTSSTFSAMGDDEPNFARSGMQLAVTSTRYAANNPEIVLLGIPGATSPFRLTNDPGVDGQAAIQPVP